MCSKEIGPHAQDMITILDSIINIIGRGGGVNMTNLMSTRIFTLIMNKIFIRAPNITRNVATSSIWIWQPSHTKDVFHNLGEMG